jgi:V/A-type H+-transporting ATPase subunit C
VTAVAETRLLTNDEFLDLLRLSTLQELFGRIRQVETYALMPAPESPDAASRTVEREFIAHVRTLAARVPDGRVCRLMLVGYYFAELRAFVGERLLPDRRGGQAPGFFTEAELEALWNDSIDAPGEWKAVMKRVRETLEDSDEPARLLDLVLDREELIHLLEQSRATGCGFIVERVREHVLSTAALTVVRARLAGEDPAVLAETFLAAPLDDERLSALAREETSRLGAAFARNFAPAEEEAVELSRSTLGRLARMSDDRGTAGMTPARLVTFGPERIFGYLWGLRIENLNLRLITGTFAVEGSRDEARRRLRLSYV